MKPTPHHALLGALAALTLQLAPPAHALEVTPTSDAATLTQQLFASVGLQVTAKSYTGAPSAAGTFKKGPLGLPDGIILSSGSAKAAEPPNADKGTATDHQGAGDPLCDKLVPGFGTFDAARLDVSFKIDAKTQGIRFEYMVGTEEYPEFLGQTFNDVVGVFVDGKNVALDAKGNIISINGPFFAGQTVITDSGTEFDGATPRLTVDVPLPDAATEHTLTIVVCDAGDGVLDTAVLLAGFATCTGTECSKATTTSWCGDGKVDPATEQCDDGNNVDDDGCSNACTTTGSAPVCGDGAVEGDEQCDDGNTTDGDGCDKDCKKEAPTLPVCGDGKVEGDEQCDDGNTTDGDGCDKGCKKETPAQTVCGDGKVEGDEQCDDGNTTDGDGCDKGCKTETPATGDTDGDGISDDTDNCPEISNADQQDLDGNGVGDACEAEGAQLMLTGGACTASPTQTSGPWQLAVAFALAMLALALRRSRRARASLRSTGTAALALSTAASVLTLAPQPAQAADYQLDAQIFTPSTYLHDGVSVGRGQTDGGYPWSLGLVLDYQKNPVVLRRDTGADSEVLESLVSHRLTANLMGSVRLASWLSVGVGVPIVPLQGGNAIGPFAEPSSFALGDVRLAPRVRVLTAAGDAFHLALALDVTLPTGKLFDHYTGRSSLTVAPGILGDYRVGAVTMVANASVVFAGTDQVANISLSHRIDLRGALVYEVAPRDVELLAELQGTTQLTAPFSSIVESPLEVRGAVRKYMSDSLVALVGVGAGLTRGAGNPDFRVFTGLHYAPRDPAPKPKPKPAPPKPVVQPKPKPKPKPPADRDGDGLVDPKDKCPDEPEDKDGFEDDDGCPDPDDDADKVCDPWVPDQGKSEKYKDRCTGRDLCPRKPETYNTYKDDDGCPDQAVKIEKKKIIILQVVNFYLDETRIKEESLPLLDEVVQVLKDHKELAVVRIEGHTDLRGRRRHNMKLSRGRAKAIYSYLIDKGIAKSRLRFKGYGPTRPIHKRAKTEAEHLANRRVEFNILRRVKE